MSNLENAGDTASEPKPEAVDISDAHDQSSTSAELMPTISPSNDVVGLRPNSLDGALHELFNADMRRHPVAVIISIASAWARDISLRNTALADRQAMSLAENRKLSGEIAVVREENAALKAENAASKRHGPLKAIIIFIAPVIFVLAIDEFRVNKYGTGFLLTAIGVAMLFGVWVSTRRGGREK